MFCKVCGKEVDDKAVICPSCGCKVEETAATDVGTPAVKVEKNNKINVLGLIGFILSVCSLFLSLYGSIAVAGVILSIIGLVQCVKNGYGLKGFPIAGIVVGACSIIYTIYVICLAIIIAGMA